MKTIRVLLMEDDPDWIEGLELFIGKQNDMEVVAATGNFSEGVAEARKSKPDVAILDIYVHGEPQGLRAAREIIRCCSAKVVMLTGSDEDELLFEALRIGAVDYIVKDRVHEIPDAIRAAYHNQSALRGNVAAKVREEFRRLKTYEHQMEVERMKKRFTGTELEVMKWISKGCKRKEVAEKMVVSEKTVKNHINHILRKTGESRVKKAAENMKKLGIL
ncbi:MAG TPA: response regulator transcription factor [Bacillales bacterium]|nr:response regulator transcription factor [Bacillales bacterium]